MRSEKISPPFEGGVAGTIDYLIVTRLISRPGWLIYSFLSTFIYIINNNLFNRKGLNLSDHLQGTDPPGLRPHYGINHPGR
jgi:hypothetical protein